MKKNLLLIIGLATIIGCSSAFAAGNYLLEKPSHTAVNAIWSTPYTFTIAKGAGAGDCVTIQNQQMGMQQGATVNVTDNGQTVAGSPLNVNSALQFPINADQHIIKITADNSAGTGTITIAACGQ
jgi:hypothetical protein